MLRTSLPNQIIGQKGKTDWRSATCGVRYAYLGTATKQATIGAMAIVTKHLNSARNTAGRANGSTKYTITRKPVNENLPSVPKQSYQKDALWETLTRIGRNLFAGYFHFP